FVRNSSTAEANTPRAILTWHASDQQMIYASYAQGFRSGYPQTATVISIVPNFPPVSPDRLYNYEIGSKGSFVDGRFAYDVSVYYEKWREIQQVITVEFNDVIGFPALVNAGNASGKGIDLTLIGRPVDPLTLKASVSWNSLAYEANILSGGQV